MFGKFKNQIVLFVSFYFLASSLCTALYPKRLGEQIESRTPLEVINSIKAPIVYGTGSKVIVEYFDYNCYHCRKSENYIFPLPENVKLIMAPLPVLGRGSYYAASSIIAAEDLVKGYGLKMHEELKKYDEKIEVDEVLETAQKIGLNISLLNEKINGSSVMPKLVEIAKSAVSLEVQGTPSFVKESGVHHGSFKSREDFLKWVNE